MKLNGLKIIRVVVALLVFSVTLFVFLDFSEIFGPGLKKGIVYPQFIPSLIGFFKVAGFVSLGFLNILVLTLLFGRVYCSFLCPLGILQDIAGFIKRKFRKKHYYRFTKPFNWLRYIILGATTIVLVSGSMLMVNLLDPYSNFGRISVQLFRPAYIGLNNAGVKLLGYMDNYSLYHVDIKSFDIFTFVFSSVLLLTIIILVIKHGRLYCNTVCPVGTLLGLCSKGALFKLKIEEPECTGCGLCERVCKAECIDIENKKIDESRCIDCYNCIKACPSNTITYRFAYRKNKPLPEMPADKNRRKLLAGTFMYFLTVSGLAAFGQKIISPQKKSKIPENKQNPVVPPGALSIEHFNNTCTACHLCVSACPTKVLQPSLFEYGISGIMQPMMDYHTSFCNFECNQCTKVCPSGAILKISKAEKITLQIGIAKFIKKNCIVFTENTDCGACAEHCPTKAVHMVTYKNGLKIPEVTPDICVGCGACEYACPTLPYKAIYVEGNTVHCTAEKPVEKPAKKPKEEIDEEFPF